MTTAFTERILGWNPDWSGYWGPRLFTIGVALALLVELAAIVAGFLRKPRVTVDTGN
jgi:hypothetical protein